MTDTTLTDTERAGNALMLCECGHDIGGEHNSRGCYHIEWRRDYDLKCDCLLTDDRNVAALIGKRHLAIVAARVADRDTWWREALATCPCGCDVSLHYTECATAGCPCGLDGMRSLHAAAAATVLAAEARTQGGAL